MMTNVEYLKTKKLTIEMLGKCSTIPWSIQMGEYGGDTQLEVSIITWNSLNIDEINNDALFTSEE